jgi:hypothetical protein
MNPSKDEKESKFCPKCPYKAKYSQSIYTHYITVHGYTCTQCDFTVQFKRDLIHHVDMIHNKQNLTCTICPFTATTMSSLLEHFKSNHNSITFHCAQCKFQTKWRPNLHKHMKKNHP